MASVKSIGSATRWTVVVLMIAIVGCDKSANHDPDRLFPQAVVKVNPDVLKDYVGVYELPSGAHFPVTLVEDRLLGGTPPTELHAQSTRRFTSTSFFGEIRFDRDASGTVHRLDYRQAKHSHWCKRVDPLEIPDPIQLIDAGGIRLRMLTVGQGTPTIILEDGFGNGIEMQSTLQSALSVVSRVVAYDHAGTGGSDQGPEPRDARQVARELRTALRNANIHPPYLFVGGSIGGDYCRVFVHEHPEDVVGLVLLDPTPDWEKLLRWAKVNAPERVQDYRRIARESETVMDKLMQRQEPGRAAEWSQLAASRRLAHDALPLPPIPFVQITGAVGRRFSSVVDDKIRFFDAWLSEHIPHAQHVLAHNSAHAVPMTDQKLVVDEVRKLVEASAVARSRKP